MGFSKVHNTKLVRGGTILVALYALIQFSGLSFGLTQRLPMSKVPTRLSVKLGNVPLAVYSERVHIASPPVVRDWKVQEVLNDVMSDASGSGRISPPIKLVVIPNSAFFEAQGFTYFVQANKLPIDVSFVTGVVEIDSSVQLVASDYVVTKTGDQGPRWTLQDAIVVTERLQQKRDNSGMQFVQIGEYALPDGSVAHLYRHRRASP